MKMKILLKVTVGAGLVLASSFGVGSALAQKSSEPTQEDLKKSTQRGLLAMPRVPSTQSSIRPVTTKINTQPTNSVHTTESKDAVKAPHIVQQKKSAKPQIAVRKHKHGSTANIATTKSSVKMVSTSSETLLVNGSEQVVTAWLNKQGPNPSYKNSEKMQVNVRATKDCNLMIFDFDGHGKLTQIFPNDYQQNTYVHAGETVCIGGSDSPFEYQVSIPRGQAKAKESVFIYAYPTNEAPLSVAMNHLPNAPFRGTEMNMEQYRKLVNQSKVYFARGIDVVPKKGAKLVSAQAPAALSPNKIELSFSIDR
jgi:hypothetical protein